MKDREKLRNFIRLVDYLSVETLVQTNQLSMNTLLEEMKKERKQGLFGSSVIVSACGGGGGGGGRGIRQ